eukprot:1626365-Rhodomonas_salina.2
MYCPIALMGSPPLRIPGNEMLNANLKVKGQLCVRRHSRRRPTCGRELGEKGSFPNRVLTGCPRRVE